MIAILECHPSHGILGSECGGDIIHERIVSFIYLFIFFTLPSKTVWYSVYCCFVFSLLLVLCVNMAVINLEIFRDCILCIISHFPCGSSFLLLSKAFSVCSCFNIYRFSIESIIAFMFLRFYFRYLLHLLIG